MATMGISNGITEAQSSTSSSALPPNSQSTPKSSHRGISIRRGTAADLPEIARLSDLAFKTSEWSRAMYPVHDSVGNTARYLRRHTKCMDEGKAVFFVAVEDNSSSSSSSSDGTPTAPSTTTAPTTASPSDPSGPSSPSSPSGSSGSGKPGKPLLGFARWELLLTPRPESDWNTPYEPIPVAPGANAAANDRMAIPMHHMRLKHYRGDPMVLLNFLAVDPAFQRRGVGKALLQWGLAEADRLGLPAWLEATKAGLKLYADAGYVAVDVICEDLSEYGVVEPSVITIMRREPVGVGKVGAVSAAGGGGGGEGV